MYVEVVSFEVRVSVIAKKMYSDKEQHDIKKTNAKSFRCRSMSANNGHLIKKIECLSIYSTGQSNNF